MVKLTPELISQCIHKLNPVRDREIDLRGYKIPVIENLGATLDQFDCIELSDNDIRKLDGFPYLKRLKCLLLNNNRVCRIAEKLEENIPNLESLVLTNNHIQELSDIDNLSPLKSLWSLSLLKNPVTTKKHYRFYTIYKLPQLRVLDFCKVKLKERQEAEKLFKGKKGKKLEKEISTKPKSFTPGAASIISTSAKTPAQVPDVASIKNAIKKAGTLEEVEKLRQMLKSGQIPGKESLMDQRLAHPNEDEAMDTETVKNGN